MDTSESAVVNSGLLVRMAATVVFVVAYPLALAVLAHRRLHVGWRYLAYGAIVFFVFQLATRVPAVQLIQSAFGEQLKASPTLMWTWLVVLALTAGLFEEVGRYIGYRVFMRRQEKTWSKAIMCGIGHGGLESIVPVGGLTLIGLVNLWSVARGGLTQLPEHQRVLAAQQIATLNAQPAWAALLSAWERPWTVPIQVAFSVVVLQVFVCGKSIWLLWAILGHAFVDLVAVGLQQVLGPSLGWSLVIEVVVAVFGLIAVWISGPCGKCQRRASLPKPRRMYHTWPPLECRGRWRWPALHQQSGRNWNPNNSSQVSPLACWSSAKLQRRFAASRMSRSAPQRARSRFAASVALPTYGCPDSTCAMLPARSSCRLRSAITMIRVGSNRWCTLRRSTGFTTWRSTIRSTLTTR